MNSKWKLWLGRLLALFIVTSGALWLMMAPEAQSLNRLEQLMLVFFGSGILFLFFLRVRWTMFFFTSSVFIALILKSDLRNHLLPREVRPLASLAIQYFDFSAEIRPGWQRRLMHTPGDLLWVYLPDTTSCLGDHRLWRQVWPQVWCMHEPASHFFLSRLLCQEERSTLPVGFREKRCALQPQLQLCLVTAVWQPAMPLDTLEAALGNLAARHEPAVLLLLAPQHLLYGHLKSLVHSHGLAICRANQLDAPLQWQERNRTPALFVIHNLYLCCRRHHSFEFENASDHIILSVFDALQSNCHEKTH